MKDSGGGGGIRQPLVREGSGRTDHAATYKPGFHYLILQRNGRDLLLHSRFLQPDFSRFTDGYAFAIKGAGP